MRFFKEMLAKSHDPKEDELEPIEAQSDEGFADVAGPDAAAWEAAEQAAAPSEDLEDAAPEADPNGGDLDALRKALLELGDTEDDIDAYLAEGEEDALTNGKTPPIKSHFGRAMEQKNARLASSFQEDDGYEEDPETAQDGASFLAHAPEEPELEDEEADILKRQETKEAAMQALRQMRTPPPPLRQVPSAQEDEPETTAEDDYAPMLSEPDVEADAEPEEPASVEPFMQAAAETPVAAEEHLEPQQASQPQPAAARKIWDIQEATSPQPMPKQMDEPQSPPRAAVAQAPAPVAEAPLATANDAETAAALAAARPARRAGRVKTRLLGFQPVDDLASDIFDTPSAEPRRGPAPAQDVFPVGWIVVADGAGRGNAFTLFSGVSQIGRGEGQAVRLDFGDNSISRQNHAAVAYDDETGKFYLGHGGKSNIVRLNGKPVLSTEELGANDTIRIGETTLRFVALCGEDFDWGAQNEGEAGHAATG